MTDHLPERCFVALPGVPKSQNVFVCVRGDVGVQATSVDFGDFEAARHVVRRLNEALGIGPVQERAMLIGCLTGWSGGRRAVDPDGWQTSVTVH